MKPYILALLAGVLVGVIYGLIKVRSPAPPVMALVGLFGILMGEQIVARLRPTQPPVAMAEGRP